MSVAGIVVTAVLGCWFAISVASQVFEDLGSRLPWLSGLGLVPCWTFFAPRPGMSDMHLLYRDKFSDNRPSGLTVVPTIEERRWYHATWNPAKFHNKIFSDLTSSLRRQLREITSKKRDLRAIMLSTPYIMMVHFVMRMPRPADAIGRQFILVTDKGFELDRERVILFMSEFHHFDKRQEFGQDLMKRCT